MVKERISVSVIIPVYNVYGYLDQCMESVVNQTFSDFEVLLINDGSTDGSDIKCMEWAKRDKRIRVISKINEGVSKARNYGMQNAFGEYLVFIDADDWVDPFYLEKLYQTVVENKADISECDIYRVDNRTGKKSYCVCSGNMGVPYTLEEHMKYGNTAIWKCMIRKSLFTEHEILFPDCHSPARAIYALLLAVSGKVANVHEALYYYRRFRTGSLTEKPRVNNGDENAVGLAAFDNLLQGFQKCGLYSRYEKHLQDIVRIKLSDLSAGLFYRRGKDEYVEITRKYDSYLKQRFPEMVNDHYLTLGGYNLNRILCCMKLFHNPYGRFNFSSIISIMHPVTEPMQCIHENKYREIMVNRDVVSEFWDIVEEIRPQFIFLDFIEERFDLIQYADGYITKSDAFDGIKNKPDGRLILKRDSKECLELWKQSFQKFVNKIGMIMPECRIVVVENYLSEQVGDIYDQLYFEEIDEIRKTNRMLQLYYASVAERYQQIPIINASKCKYYFTDKQYEYGAIPSHLNEIVNREIAKLIEKNIGL